MKVPLEWLKGYVAVRLPAEALAERLTMAGLEVIAIEQSDGEPVLDLEVTPNRADCLSIIGVAREVAAITGTKMKLPLASSSKPQAPSKGRKLEAWSLKPEAPLTIRIEDRRGCRRYIGRLIDGVRIGPSPVWMQTRLIACGLRPINNVVDITNYVLLEWGQPLHAFDGDRLIEHTIIVRRARVGETLVTLDDSTHTLSPNMTIIADAKRPVAIAGVMGGRDAQVTGSTTRVVLESAWFDPILVRRTARALGLASESSYRFERGVDPRGVEEASRRAAALIAELANGREVAVQDVGQRTPKPIHVRLEASRVSRWLGTPVPHATASRALQRLGCTVRQQATGWPPHLSSARRADRPLGRTAGSPTASRQVGGWRVRVPSSRRDLRRDVDLIEEIARLWGYDRLPATIPQAPIGAASVADAAHAGAQTLRQLCTGLGLWEIITWSLISEASLARAGCAEQGKWARLVNPLSRDHAVLRPTLLVGMLQAISRNLAQGVPGVRFFELGNIFESSSQNAQRVQERLHLGIGIAGLWEQDWQGDRKAELFRLKGIAGQLTQRSTRQPLIARACSLDWAEPGQSMELLLGDRPLGAGGQVARRICEAHDCDESVWFVELAADTLLKRPPSAATLTIPSAFPPVKRDVSFLVDRQVEFAKLLGLIRTVGSPLAAHVELIDRYTGPTVPDAQHSLTFSIEYRDPSRTLTSAEADQLHAKVIHALTERFHIQLR